MRSSDYIDQIRKQRELPSDYAAAKVLGVNKERVSSYRRGVEFSDEMAIRVAELLGLEPLKVLADVRAQSAKDDQTRQFWRKVGGLSPAMAAVMLSGELTASAMQSMSSADWNALLCLLC